MTIAAAGFGFVFGIYTVSLYVGWSNQIVAHANSDRNLVQDADVSDRWKQLGRDYDDEVEFSEGYWFTNIRGKRKKLVSLARGNVLEVSCGTGRNFEWYDLEGIDPTRERKMATIEKLVLNDQSSVMIAAAEKKIEAMAESEEREKGRQELGGKVEFVVGDAGIRGVINRPPGGFDTIVQTMGLCSMVDPVGFLKTIGSLCRQPGEKSKTRAGEAEDDGKGGRILLLEHGRSRFGLVNKVLDSGASMHADHYGCWWNKDIGKIVEQSGLVVEKIKRYHFGTTWEIHLRPKER